MILLELLQSDYLKLNLNFKESLKDCFYNVEK